MVPNVVLNFYSYKVFCTKEEIRCIREYTARPVSTSMAYFVLSLDCTEIHIARDCNVGQI